MCFTGEINDLSKPSFYRSNNRVIVREMTDLHEVTDDSPSVPRLLTASPLLNYKCCKRKQLQNAVSGGHLVFVFVFLRKSFVTSTKGDSR